MPNDAEDYVHRVGRTARAKSSGVALTLINEYDMGKFGMIENSLVAPSLNHLFLKALNQDPNMTRARVISDKNSIDKEAAISREEMVAEEA